MSKAPRSLRLSDRTWKQLKQLAPWLEVDDRTKVVEKLAEKEFERMSAGWLTQKYNVGQIIKAPHPADNQMRDAKITTFTVDKSDNSFSNRPNGIMVKFEDGVWMEIPQGLLNEDGSGM